MPHRHAIVIAVDGLRASALGAYGNTWHATPALDRLASEAVVFDWMIADSPQVAGFYRAAWLGVETPRDGVERSLAEYPAGTGLLRLLADGAVHGALTTDDPRLAEAAEKLGVGDVRSVEFPQPATTDAIADTQLAQLFAIAADQIERWSAAGAEKVVEAPPTLLWIHARGYHGAWDAPTELRQSLLDDEDPPALPFVMPPVRLETDDHDELLLHRAAYAAQTIVLDECVGMLLATLENAGLADSTLVMLVGCRGFALGEHGAVGSEVRELYGEVTQVPLLVRFPHSTQAPPPRSSDLMQPNEIGRILSRWFGVAEQSCEHDLATGGELGFADGRVHALSTGGAGEFAVRTAFWLLRRSGSEEGADATSGRVELYAKPDDRWEANEIANLLPEVTAELEAVGAEFRRSSGATGRHAIANLDVAFRD